MLNKSLTKGLQALLLAGAGLLGLAGQSQAAVFVGSFDPPFGGNVTPLNQMGFRGQASFYVPDACLTEGNGFFNNYPSLYSCTDTDKIKMISAHVELYDSLAAAVQPTLAEVNFGEYIFPDYSSSDNVLIVNGAVVGVNTQILFGLEDVVVDNGTEVLYRGSIGLAFYQSCLFNDHNYCFIEESFASSLSAQNPSGEPDRVTLYALVCDNQNNCAQTPSDAPGLVVNFNRVPEPASIALVFAALGAGLASRRRRLVA